VRRRWLLGVIALGVVAVVGGITTWVLVAAGADEASAPPTPDGPMCEVAVEPAATPDAAPAFRVPGLDGGCIDLADHRGKPVVLNFWASWCTPCREEFPLLKEANERHADDGLEIIGVSYRDIDDDARRFAADEGANWLLGFDEDDTIARAYGVRPIPQTFFIDRAGNISSRRFRPFLTMKDLEQELEPILAD
jgi:cytochrome c biogenesis protein CcmG/thiol:disulfide interchange protein DsbE